MMTDEMTQMDMDQRELMAEIALNYAQTGKEPWIPGYTWLIENFPQEWKAAVADARIEADALAQEREASDTAIDEVLSTPKVGQFLAPKIAQDLKVPTIEELFEMRQRLGRKFDVSDVTTRPGMKQAARDYAESYEDTFEFMVNMKSTLKSRGSLSDGQVKGVLNCMTARKPEPLIVSVHAPRVAESRVTEDGMYRLEDGTIYKVQYAKSGSGSLYAKLLVVIENEGSVDSEGCPTKVPATVYFDYAPGALKNITPDDKMTLEEAKAFGALYGTCCQCGRTLTDENSIEAGIGPICAKKF